MAESSRSKWSTFNSATKQCVIAVLFEELDNLEDEIKKARGRRLIDLMESYNEVAEALMAAINLLKDEQ